MAMRQWAASIPKLLPEILYFLPEDTICPLIGCFLQDTSVSWDDSGSSYPYLITPTDKLLQQLLNLFQPMARLMRRIEFSETAISTDIRLVCRAMSLDKENTQFLIKYGQE